MRGMRTGLLVVGAHLLALCGCANDSHIRPPKIEHEYVLPPVDDPRFSKYPQFPEKTLNVAPTKPSLNDMGGPATMPRSPGRMGAGMPRGY